MIDLKPEQLTLVKRILSDNLPKGAQVYLFGSRVKEQARQYSDIDLLIKSNNPLPIAALANLKEAFAESDLPMRTDISEWQRLSDSFKSHIEQDCVKIFEA